MLKQIITASSLSLATYSLALGDYPTTYNASLCSILPTSANTPSYWGGGTTIKNMSSFQAGESLDITCPIPRHGQTSNHLATLKVWVKDTHPEEDITCSRTEWYINESGNEVYTFESRSTEGLDEDIWHHLEWHSSQDNLEEPPASLQFGLSCTIPPQDENGNTSEIGSFFKEEHEN